MRSAVSFVSGFPLLPAFQLSSEKSQRKKHSVFLVQWPTPSFQPCSRLRARQQMLRCAAPHSSAVITPCSHLLPIGAACSRLLSTAWQAQSPLAIWCRRSTRCWADAPVLDPRWQAAPNELASVQVQCATLVSFCSPAGWLMSACVVPSGASANGTT